MGTAQTDNFRLRWNDFEANLSSAFRDLRQNDDFFDVTLATCPPEDAGAADVKGAIDQEAQAVLRAHKLVLSACSPFFRNLLRGHASLLPHPHPVIYLRGVKPKDLANVLDFMYHGEVNVAQDDLESFLAAAEDLKVKGLTENNQASSSSGHDDQHTPQHTPQHQQPRQRQQQHTHTPSSASSSANPLRMPKNGPGSVNKGKGIKRPGQDAGLVGGVTPKKLPKTAPSSASSSASTQQSLHPSESDSHAAAEDDDDDILEVTAVKVEASSAASGSGQQGTSHTHTLKSEEAMLADEDELAPEDYLEEGGDYDEGNYDEGAYDEQGEGKMMEAAGGAGGAVGAGDGQDRRRLSISKQIRQMAAAAAGAATTSSAAADSIADMIRTGQLAQTNDGGYLCLLCGTSLAGYQNNIKRHFDSKHTTHSVNYTCPVCHNSYANKNSFSSHFYRNHKHIRGLNFDACATPLALPPPPPLSASVSASEPKAAGDKP